MISDFVKGKKKFEFSRAVREGIELHRAIDHFTDTHPATQTVKGIFKADYGLYSAVFADVVYDHFLAIDAREFTDDSLFRFSQWVYNILEDRVATLPLPFQKMFPYMKQHNWLYHYQHRWAIARSLQAVAYRAKYLTESEIAFGLFSTHYDTLQACYTGFFPEARAFAHSIYTSLNRETA